MSIFLEDAPRDYHLSTNSALVFEQAKGIAGDYGNRALRTEHVLIALTATPQVQRLFRNYDINPDQIHGMAQDRAELFRIQHRVDTWMLSTGLISSLKLANPEVAENQPLEPADLLRGIFKQRAVFATWPDRYNPPAEMRHLLRDIGLTIAGQTYQGTGSLVPEMALIPTQRGGEFDYSEIPSYDFVRGALETSAYKLLSEIQRFILERRYPPKGYLPISLNSLAFGLDTKHQVLKRFELVALGELKRSLFMFD